MIRGLALVLLLAGFVKLPAGWREDVEQGKVVSAKGQALSHFGGQPSTVTTQVFVPPSGVGALFVTTVTTRTTTDRDAAARAEIDSFMGAPRRSQSESSKTSVGMQLTVPHPQTMELEAALQWSDDLAQIATHARLLVAADRDHLVAVSAECVFGAATPPPQRDACDQALATLQPDVALDNRVALALAPEGSEPPPAPGSDRPGPSMSEVPHTPVPSITLPSQPQQPTVDRRPVYVGLGIVVLAGLFWLNRRRRDRLEAKDNDER